MMNRNFIKFSVIVFALSLAFVSCKKEEEDLQAKEIVDRERYIQDNNITTAPKASGLYYIETLQGDGKQAVADSMVLLKYEASLLNGEVLGSDTSEFLLGADLLIAGFEEGISYMKVGGKATLIVPSELAHGANGNSQIPAYSTLIYKLELLDVFDPAAREERLIKEFIIDNEITVEPKTSGLYYIESKEGDGNKPISGETVSVTYKGRFIDGTIFDSGSFSFQMDADEVIPGFEEGVSYMKKGGTATIIVPSKLGYGKTGYNSIPPFATLIFELELLK